MIAWPMILVLALFFLGIPCAFAMLLGAIPYFYLDPFIKIAVVAQKMIANCESTSLLAVPFFIAAGSIMGQSGITEKLMDFGNACVGHLVGGLGHVNVLVSCLMGGVSGSGAADCATDCKMLVPEMVKHGYGKAYCAAITAATGCITPIIPPGINLILFACLAECSVGRLLAAGYLPGILLGIGMALANHFISKKRGYGGERKKMIPIMDLLKLSLSAFWALFLPFGLLMMLRFGVCTPTEGGALMSFYSIIIGKYVYKKLEYKQLPGLLLEAVLTCAPCMMVLCASNVFSYYMTWETIPKQLAAFIIGATENKYLFLLLCNVIFLLIGCFMDAMAAMIVITPMLVPVVRYFGIDIIHFGLMMCLNVGLAAITPPFGTYIFLVSGTLRLRTTEMIRELVPFLIVAFIVLMLVTYIPWISTIIPTLLYG